MINSSELFDDQRLAQSAVVANNRMNRERKATGINSYEKDIQLNPIQFIENRLQQSTIHWLDLCCGAGNALIETARHFKQKKQKTSIQLTGIDLVDFFENNHQLTDILTLKPQNLSNWIPAEKYDLITVVHGLHYVGDKLGLIQKATAALKEDGLFIGNLDLNNIKISGKTNSTKWLKSYFKKEKISYQTSNKIIKIAGAKLLTTPFQYLGANDKAGPNYTGQEAVNSYYQLV